MNAKFGVGEWIPMPRFEHLQPSGKKRLIDDGFRYEHNDTTGYEQTMECCTVVQPRPHLRAVAKEARSEGVKRDEFRTLRFETGGEDMPDAYRWIPSMPCEAQYNVIAVYDERTGEWMFQIIYGHVFGKGVAVNNFHEVKVFLQTMGRRWTLVLVSMFFDDATIQDLCDAKGRGQRHFRSVTRLVGFPMAKPKQFDMCYETNFIGLVHNVRSAAYEDVIKFWPRETH